LGKKSLHENIFAHFSEGAEMNDLRTPLPYEDGRTYCPDCEQWIPTDDFIPHREREHPPTTTSLSGVGGIESQTRFGYDLEE
jgi:hypothetical protein